MGKPVDMDTVRAVLPEVAIREYLNSRNKKATQPHPQVIRMDNGKVYRPRTYARRD